MKWLEGLRDIDEDVIRLNLENNQLTELPEDIGELTSLKELHLENNQLTALPEAIGELMELEELYLGHNQLTALPEGIVQLTELHHLNLGSNQLTTLPESIGALTELEHLHLGSNQLIAIPESITRFTNLTFLSLEHNQLTRLPEGIVRLTYLLVLKLEHNQLTALPEGIVQLTELKEVYLENNQLTALPEDIGTLRYLQVLNLENNQLTRLPESIGALTELQELYLAHNQLTTLPDMSKLTKLDQLHLGSNQLTRLPEGIGALTNLRYLDLTYNRLNTLPESIVQLIELQDLILSITKITDFPWDITNFPNLNMERLMFDINANRQLNELALLLETYDENPITLGVSDLKIDPSRDIAMDFIEGDIKVTDHLNANDGDNIVIYDKINCYAMSKTLLKEILYKTYNDFLDNIIFECREPDTMRPDNIVYDVPYFMLNKISSLLGTIPLNQIQSVIRDESVRCVQLVETKKHLVSTISLRNTQITGHTPDWVSAKHCQTGQDANVYNLLKIELPSPIKRKRNNNQSNAPPSKQGPSKRVSREAGGPTRKKGFKMKSKMKSKKHRIPRKRTTMKRYKINS